MKNHKLLIGIVALVVVALGVYLYFSRGSKTPAPTSTLVSTNTGNNPVATGDVTAAASSFAGSDIATMLRNVSQIKLNTNILQSPSFLALVDTTLTLPPTTVSGRVNPFGIGGSSVAPASTTGNSTPGAPATP